MPRLRTVLKRQYRLIVAVILLVTLLSLLGAALTPRKFTAQAQVIAGQIGVSAAAVPSYAVAAESLAQTFSRVFDGDAVQQRIADELGPDTIAAISIDASPVPATSVILVEAVGPSSDAAVAAADAGARALTEEVSRLLDASDVLKETAERFAAASRRLTTAQAAFDAAQADLESARGAQVIDEAQQRVAEQSAAVSTAQAEVDAYQAALTDAAGNTDAANAVQPLASARLVDDNGIQRFQLWGVTGLVIGGGLGLGVGYAVELRQALRDERAVGPSRRRRRTNAALPTPVREGEAVR